MARNDITGDSIANTKGSAEKYAQGWEGIFGRKAEPSGTEVACANCGWGRVVAADVLMWNCFCCGSQEWVNFDA